MRTDNNPAHPWASPGGIGEQRSDAPDADQPDCYMTITFQKQSPYFINKEGNQW